MKTHTSITFRKTVGITNKPQRKRPKKPMVDRPYSVSTPLEAHLRAWWQAARRARNIHMGGLTVNFDYIGGSKEWPHLVHVGALAQLAGRTYHKRISKNEMGAWMRSMGKTPWQKTVHMLDHRGRRKYTTRRTFYVMD